MAPDDVPPALDAPEDDGLVLGLERAVAKARTHVPDPDRSVDDLAPLSPFALSPSVEAESAIDTSAVMDVLRGAIDRYTNGDAHELGTWAAPEVGVAPPREPRHMKSTFEPDRRRIAAVVVVLFLVFGGVAFALARSGGSSGVKTEPTVVSGKPVTTLARPGTSFAPVGSPPSTDAPTTEASTQPQHATPTTRGHSASPPPTTAPATDPTGVTDTTDTTDTTVPDTTTTEVTTTSAPPTCTTDLPVCS